MAKTSKQDKLTDAVTKALIYAGLDVTRSPPVYRNDGIYVQAAAMVLGMPDNTATELEVEAEITRQIDLQRWRYRRPRLAPPR